MYTRVEFDNPYDINKNIHDPIMLQYSLKVLRTSLPHLIKSNYGFNIEKAYETHDIHSILVIQCRKPPHFNAGI